MIQQYGGIVYTQDRFILCVCVCIVCEQQANQASLVWKGGTITAKCSFSDKTEYRNIIQHYVCTAHTTRYLIIKLFARQGRSTSRLSIFYRLINL